MGLRRFPGVSTYHYSPRGIVTNDLVIKWMTDAAESIAQAEHWSEEFERAKARLEETPEFKKGTEAQRRDFYKINWDMGDAAAKYNFHRERANMLSAAIMAQESIRRIWIEENE